MFQFSLPINLVGDRGLQPFVMRSAYSPNLNPIMQVIANLKQLVRKAADRTKEIVWRRITPRSVYPAEMRKLHRNAGYGSI